MEGHVARPRSAAGAQDKARTVQLQDTLLQLSWSARREDWAGVVDSRHLQYVHANLGYVMARMPDAITKTFFQVLLSVVQRAVSHLHANDPAPIRLSVLNNAVLAAKMLTQLVEHESVFTPSSAPNPSPVQGQTVSEASLIDCSVEGISAISERRWLAESSGNVFTVLLSLYNALWRVVAVLVTDRTETRAVKFTLKALTSDAIVADVSRPHVITTSFLRHMSSVLVSLARGSIDNWPEVTLKLLGLFLRLGVRVNNVSSILDQAPLLPPMHTARLGAIDLFHLTASLVVVTEAASLQLQTGTAFGHLLANPVPNPSLFEHFLGAAANRERLFRTAIVKSLQDVCVDAQTANPVVVGLLSAAASHHAVMDPPAQASLLQTTRKFALTMKMDLGDTALPPPLANRVAGLCHVLAVASLPPAWVQSLNKQERATFTENVKREYTDIVLADELIFQDAERTVVNSSFLASSHLQNHHKIFTPHTAGLHDVIKQTNLSRDETFITSIHAHALSINSLLRTWFDHARQDKQKQHEFQKFGVFLEKSFANILAVIVLAAPESEKHTHKVASLDTSFKIKCVSILESYFPAFKYTFLPPLPPPLNSVERRNDKIVQRYRVNMAHAQKKRTEYMQMTGSLTVLLRLLENETKKGKRYTETLLEGVERADKMVKNASDTHQLWTLTFKLYCLRLAVSAEEAKLFAHAIPRLLLFFKGYPNLILLSAHSLVVKLMKEHSREAAKGFCLYINACIPTRAAHDGSLYVDPKLFPTTTLLKEFTKNIRSVCQMLEEWDVFDDRLSEEASGIGLVMYTVEALKHCIMYFIDNENGFSHKVRQEAAAKKRLYINALVNLLQCSTTDVLTKVCSSLESILSSLTSVNEVSFWLGYTSKRIKQQAHNPSTKQQVVAWFLSLQSLLAPGKLPQAGPLRAKL